MCALHDNSSHANQEISWVRAPVIPACKFQERRAGMEASRLLGLVSLPTFVLCPRCVGVSWTRNLCKVKGYVGGSLHGYGSTFFYCNIVRSTNRTVHESQWIIIDTHVTLLPLGKEYCQCPGRPLPPCSLMLLKKKIRRVEQARGGPGMEKLYYLLAMLLPDQKMVPFLSDL